MTPSKLSKRTANYFGTQIPVVGAYPYPSRSSIFHVIHIRPEAPFSWPSKQAAVEHTKPNHYRSNMFAALAGISSASSVEVTQQDVVAFLDQLLGHTTRAPPPGTVTTGIGASATGAVPASPITGAGPAGAPLRLHPQVDCYHPLGEAHSDKQVLHALALYRRLLKDTHLEVEEVVASGDKALAVGTQHVSSHLLDVGQLAPHVVQQYLGTVLPKVAEGRVPTAVQLSLGKDDAGNPVVTKITITFNLLAALLPHLELPEWQQQQLEQFKPLLLQALLATGGLSAVVEDMGAVMSATWRTVSAMLATMVGSALAAVRGGAGAASSAAGMVTGRHD